MMNVVNFQPPPRVFTLHYPPGKSLVKEDQPEVDNATIAGMVIKRLLESLDQGKTVCVAFPLAVAAFVGEPDAPQWRLREVGGIDEAQEKRWEAIYELLNELQSRLDESDTRDLEGSERA